MDLVKQVARIGGPACAPGLVVLLLQLLVLQCSAQPFITGQDADVLRPLPNYASGGAPMFTVSLAEMGVNSSNSIANMSVSVNVLDGESQRRCLPRGSPGVAGFLPEDTTEIVLPGDLEEMGYVFFNCTYVLELTLPDGSNYTRAVYFDLAESDSNYIMFAVLGISASKQSNGILLQWQDNRNRLWHVSQYKVIFLQEGILFPEDVVFLPVTERIIRNINRHELFLVTDTRVTYEIRVLPLDVHGGRMGPVAVGYYHSVHSTLGPTTPSLLTQFMAASHNPPTYGSRLSVSVSWKLNYSIPDMYRGETVRLAVVTAVGDTDRCLTDPGVFVFDYPANVTTVRFPMDFPADHKHLRVQFGCRFTYQISVDVGNRTYVSETTTVATAPRVPIWDIYGWDLSHFNFSAAARVVPRADGVTAEVEVLTTWVYPAFPGIPLQFLRLFYVFAGRCNQSLADFESKVVVPLSDDYIGKRYEAVVSVGTVPLPYCVGALLTASVAGDPDDPSNVALTSEIPIKLEQPPATTVPVTNATSSPQTMTSLPTRVTSSSSLPASSSNDSSSSPAPPPSDQPPTTTTTMTSSSSLGIPMAVVVGASVGALLLVLLALLMYIIYRRTKLSGDFTLSKMESNFGMVVANKDVVNDYNFNNGSNMKTPPKQFEGGDRVELDIAEQLRLASKMEKLGDVNSRNQVAILTHNLSLHGLAVEVGEPLGAGQFGQVFRAQLTDADGVVTNVAVKTLHAKATVDELKQFHDEIEIMKDLEPHPNVMQMLGCCEDGLTTSCLIVEYMQHGNLQDFLRKAREERTKDVLHSDQRDDPYHNEGKSVEKAEKVTVEVTGNGCLGMKDTFLFAKQVAAGMMHLEKLKIVHRDLAARNVLLGKGKELKISDFGLAKDVYHHDDISQEKGKENTPLPFKWMALESLKSNIFTSASDVWSFGIVLWELVMTGAHPYPTIDNHDIPAVLACGYRMAKPPDCPEELYAVMMECWDEIPENRPTFPELSQTLDELSDKLMEYVELGE